MHANRAKLEILYFSSTTYPHYRTLATGIESASEGSSKISKSFLNLKLSDCETREYPLSHDCHCRRIGISQDIHTLWADLQRTALAIT